MPTTIINIITSQPRGPYLPLSRGGRLVALVGVCIVWNLEPLASGGQSGHKLIPHIICQFLCARGKKTLYEDLFYKGSSANLPRQNTCENKTPFWDKSKVFASHFQYSQVLAIYFSSEHSVSFLNWHVYSFYYLSFFIFHYEYGIFHAKFHSYILVVYFNCLYLNLQYFFQFLQTAWCRPCTFGDNLFFLAISKSATPVHFLSI